MKNRTTMRALRSVGIITGNQLRRLVMDPITFVWLAALPILIIYVLGISVHSLFSPEFIPARPYRVAVVQSSLIGDKGIRDVLEALPKFFTVTVAMDEATAEQAMLAQEIDAAVIVPAELATQPVRILAVPGTLGTQIINNVVRKAIGHSMESDSDINVVRVNAAATGDSASANVTSKSAAWAGADSFQYYSIALTVMFAMFTAHCAMNFCARDHSSGAYARIRALGVRRSTYLSAGFFSAMTMGVLYFAFMTVVTSLLFGVQWGDPLAWVGFTLVSAAGVAALSFLVTALVPLDPKAVDGAGSMVFNIVAFLGGSTMPLPALPQWLASTSAWLPNRAMLEGYLRLAGGNGLQTVSDELLIVGISTLVMFSVSWILVGFRFRGEV